MDGELRRKLWIACLGAMSPIMAAVLALTFLGILATQIAPALSQTFTPQCANPSLPGKAVAIDGRCGIKGAGGDEAEQDEVKNNFCAGGGPASFSFSHLAALQIAAEQNKNINFGDRDNPSVHGPTTDRAPLRVLGEGKLVQLRAFVLTAKQEQGESVNCGHEFDSEPQENLFHDIHISLVETVELARPHDKTEEEVNECHGIVAEMIPHHRPAEWTADNVNKVAAAHLPVRVTGQLFFDSKSRSLRSRKVCPHKSQEAVSLGDSSDLQVRGLHRKM